MPKDVYPSFFWAKKMFTQMFTLGKTAERAGDKPAAGAVPSGGREPWALPERAAGTALCDTASHRDVRVQLK